MRSRTNGGNMKRSQFAPVLILIAAVTSAAGEPVANQPQLNTGRIEELTGEKGKLDEREGAFKVSVPRGDLDVRVAGVRMTPPMGLTSAPRSPRSIPPRSKRSWIGRATSPTVSTRW